MNSSTSKDFLLILSFNRYQKCPAIISSLLPLAISLCSEVRGLCRHTNAEPPRHLEKSSEKCFHGALLKVTGTTI